MTKTSTGGGSDDTNSVDSGSHGNEVVRHTVNLCRETKDAVVNFPTTAKYLMSIVYVPYFPPLFGPFPWLRIYLMPPYDKKKLDTLIADFSAGLTIGLTLIPQVICFHE
jgi:hypothetical protein